MNLVYVAGDEVVATWRTLWPAAEMRRRGHKVSMYGIRGVEPPKTVGSDPTFVLHVVNKQWTWPNGRLVTMLDLAKPLVAAGRLIVSVDDDWTKMLHVQAKPIDPRARKAHAEIPELIQLADAVIVSTPHLVEVFEGWAREIHLVENYLPEWVLSLPHPEPLDRIAWMGEMWIHGQDWNLLQPYAADLPPLYLIGPGQEAAERIQGWGARDVLTTPTILNQRKLYAEMGRGVGAIIPLEDTPFNRGKSWSKPMEFIARGVLPLASRHAEYERLHEATGVLPTYDEPDALVDAATRLWEQKPDASMLPDILRAAGMTMEQAGGDQWEKALT